MRGLGNHEFLAPLRPLCLLIPVVIFFIDDYETNGHDHGQERIIYIVQNNLGENVAAVIFAG